MNSPKIFLLSIGINTYRSDRIPNLFSCKKDTIDLRKTFLHLGLVSEENCLELHDENASRDGIIAAFRSHFQQMNDGDIAVLHYSGHGSSEYTSPEFTNAGIEPILGKNESLVPFDSDPPKIFNIADKELRVLVSELQKEKENTSFVAILDCCHSGSMFKYDNWRPKYSPPYSGIRPLDSYLDSHFLEMYKSSGIITLPHINYYSLTASAPDELANEVDDGGFFTSALISILRQENGHLTYSQLHTLSRLSVKNMSRNKQHPQFEYFGSANPYRLFLKSENSESANMPILSNRSGEWIVNVGGIHGIDSSSINMSTLPIYKKHDLLNPIGKAKIIKTYVESSIVSPIWNGDVLSNQEILFLGLPANPIAICVNKIGSTSEVKNLDYNLLDSQDFKEHFLINDRGDYELNVKSNEISIYKKDGNDKKLLTGINENTPRAWDWIKLQLKMISKWENILQLKSPKSSKNMSDLISLSFSYKNANDQKSEYKNPTEIATTEATQYINIPDIKQGEAYLYKIEIKHNYPSAKGIYCYLIHLDRTYKIKQKFEAYDKPIMKSTTTLLYDSQQEGCGLGISGPTLSQIEDHFILIASNTPLSSPYISHQEGFSDYFGQIVDFAELQKSRYEIQNSRVLIQDWCIKKLVVRLKRINI